MQGMQAKDDDSGSVMPLYVAQSLKQLNKLVQTLPLPTVEQISMHNEGRLISALSACSSRL